MELLERTVCLYFVMLVAASAGQKILEGAVGGNVTLPDPLPEEGFLLRESKILASVMETKLRVYEEPYRNRILWDQTSGLFTITDLQKSDSGLFNIDSKRGNVFVVFYNLSVFDSVAPPAVQRLNGSSDGCWLLCSVDKRSSLSWFRDQEKLEQRDSVLSLNVSISKEDLKSSFRCESSNPAGETSQTVDVKTLCSHFISEESTKLLWVAIACAVGMGVFIFGLVACLIRHRKKTRRNRTPRELGTEDSVQYTAIQFPDRTTQRTSNVQEASHLTTVYDQLQKNRMDPTEAPHPAPEYDLLQGHRMEPTEASHLTTVYDQLQKERMDLTNLQRETSA